MNFIKTKDDEVEVWGFDEQRQINDQKIGVIKKTQNCWLFKVEYLILLSSKQMLDIASKINKLKRSV